VEHALQEGCRQCKARAGWRDPAVVAAERAAAEAVAEVAADAWSGLAQLVRCAGVVLAARRECGNSAATVLAQVWGFVDLREELQAGALFPAGGAGTLRDAWAAEDERVRASRAKLEERQREVRRSAQLARAKDGPASG